VLEHKQSTGSVFTAKNNCHYLVYYEDYQHINKAIELDKNLKNGHREGKINLIEQQNPEIKDLAAYWQD
jgi:putative endonuclease